MIRANKGSKTEGTQEIQSWRWRKWDWEGNEGVQHVCLSICLSVLLLNLAQKCGFHKFIWHISFQKISTLHEGAKKGWTSCFCSKCQGGRCSHGNSFSRKPIPVRSTVRLRFRKSVSEHHFHTIRKLAKNDFQYHRGFFF